MSEFDALIEAAQAERQAILEAIAKIDAQKASLLDQAKRYERVINAADPEAKKPGRPAAPKGPKKPDWRVSSGMIEQIYDHMRVAAADNGDTEFSVSDLAKLSGVSEQTVQKTLQVLHEEGRIRFIRESSRGKRFWGVVA